MHEPNPTTRARELRRNSTDAEACLWARLRNKQLGFKFRRQCPIGPYFTDFCCKTARLVIELDGEQHYLGQGPQYDAQRTAYLNQQEYRVIRFGNQQVLADTEAVLREILVFLEDPHRLAKECEPASPTPGEATASRPASDVARMRND